MAKTKRKSRNETEPEQTAELLTFARTLKLLSTQIQGYHDELAAEKIQSFGMYQKDMFYRSLDQLASCVDRLPESVRNAIVDHESRNKKTRKR